MSSEPSERAKRWLEERNGLSRLLLDRTAPTQAMADRMFAYDAGYSEGEKKGTAVGYLAALREVKEECELRRDEATHGYIYDTMVRFVDWLDRRIREAEENAK